MKTFKCLWCSQELPLSKSGRTLKQHKNGAQQCVGNGQPIAQQQAQRDLLNKIRRGL